MVSATCRPKTRLIQPISALLLLCLGPLAPVMAEQLASNTQNQMYGEVPQANQIGKGYVVFQRQGQKVVGAFHYPRSEFSCFVGTITDQTLAVTTLESEHEQATTVDVSLSKLHAIQTMGPSEQNSLKACQTEVAALERQHQFAINMP